MPDMPEHLQQMIDNIDPEKDCVAVIKPVSDTAFYIPHHFVDVAREGLLDKPPQMPGYVMGVLAFMHITRYAQSDPMLKEMMEKIKRQVYLDIQTNPDYAGRH